MFVRVHCVSKASKGSHWIFFHFHFYKQIRTHYNFIYNWFLDIASYFKKISDNDISGEKPEHFIDACWQQHL